MRVSMRRLCLLAAPLCVAAAAPQPKKLTYQDDVLQVLRNNCLNCHNPDKKKGGMDLSSYAGMMEDDDQGKKILVAGDPDGSKLFKVLAQKEEPFMPKGGNKLSEHDLAIIHDWIGGGALETSSSTAAATPKPAVDLTILPAALGKPTGPPAMPRGLSLKPITHTNRPGPLLSLAASPWAPLVALGGQRQIVLYNTQSLECLGILPFPEGIPATLKFSRNGSLLVAGGGEGAKLGKVILYDVVTGTRAAEVGNEFDTVLAADITPNQAVVALGGPAKVLKAYRVKDNQLLWTARKHTDWVTAVACSPDGVLIASGDRSGNLFVWETRTGQEFCTLAGHKDAITGLEFRGDANVLASCSQDGTLRLWNLQDATQLRSINADGGGALSLAMAHDGRIAVCGRDHSAHLFNPDGSAGRKFEGFGDIALHVALSDDGSRLIAGDWTGKLLVFNTADGKVVGSLTANPLANPPPGPAATQTATRLSPAK